MGRKGVEVFTFILISRQKYSKIVPFDNAQELIASIKIQLDQVKETNGKSPSMLVIGALGRCGRGAMDFGKAVGLDESMMTGWDMQETAAGGPFGEILDHDLFVNCIYLSSPIPPFLTTDSLNERGAERRLSVLVDVSCDPNNPNNPGSIFF
jgi:saccharopine dehydrogenase (NAD+, L-lysine-forming)